MRNYCITTFQIFAIPFTHINNLLSYFFTTFQRNQVCLGVFNTLRFNFEGTSSEIKFLSPETILFNFPNLVLRVPVFNRNSKRVQINFQSYIFEFGYIYTEL